jgi:hypothetical protein
MHWSLKIIAVFFTALLSASAASAQPRNGTLEVRVKDDREAIGDFAQVDVIVEMISISPKVGPFFWRMGWKDLKPSVDRIDLTKYSQQAGSGARTVTVFTGGVAPGAFEAIHLKLKGAEGILKKDQSRPLIKNLVGPIGLPFTIKSKETTLIVLDLTLMDMSDHPPRGYELQLVGYELYNNGKLTDKIPPG